MITLFGLPLQNLTMDQAVERLSRILSTSTGPTPATGYFVNAHAARLAGNRPEFRRVLHRAGFLFVDGTGVRIAALLRGRRLRANLVGTDLVPALLAANAGRCFLLGGSEAINQAAAAHLARCYPHWTVAGRQHGYLDAAGEARAVDAINASGADLLLVGMGNPLQEEWIDRHAAQLRTRLALGVGGLFHHWAGDLTRAPGWVRRLGCEWLQLCLQKPRRAARYARDIPAFLWRALWTASSDRRAMFQLDRPVS